MGTWTQRGCQRAGSHQGQAHLTEPKCTGAVHHLQLCSGATARVLASPFLTSISDKPQVPASQQLPPCLKSTPGCAVG